MEKKEDEKVKEPQTRDERNTDMMRKIEEETSQLWKSMGLSFEDTEDGSEEDWKESEEASVDLDLLFLKDNGNTEIDRGKERRLEEENKSRQLEVERQREMKTVRLKEEESKRKAMMEKLKEDEGRTRGMEAEMERKEQEERLREKERAKLREEERKKKEMQEKTRRELEQITQREREEKGKKAKVAKKLLQARDSDDIDVDSLSDEDMWKDKELPMDQKKRQTKDEKEHAWLQEKHNKEKEDENPCNSDPKAVTNSNSLWMHKAKSPKLSVNNAWKIQQYDNTETDNVKQGHSEAGDTLVTTLSNDDMNTWTQLKAKTDEEDAEREKQRQMEEKRMREVDNGGKKEERTQREMVAQKANKTPKMSREFEIVQKIEEERKKEEMEKAAQKEQKEDERRKIEIEEEKAREEEIKVMTEQMERTKAEMLRKEKEESLREKERAKLREEVRKKKEMEKAAENEQKEDERKKVEIEKEKARKEERKVREREEMRKIAEEMNRRWEALPGDSDDNDGATESGALWMDEVEKRRQVEVINPQNEPQEEGERGHTQPGSAQVNVEQKKKGRSVLKWVKKRLSFGTTKVKQ
ncbi:golgin subfamily A member 6-like protein 22 [Clupea harengus]|uniref:Golgin subfamily A member 6-like protein 22 n=1 Tax=Clupea harengus TaxID=7950 RepID=A0A8M1KJS7_CLUHA|nr:golgin subfamily A member 6-like protein 22 [Clupea harengus]